MESQVVLTEDCWLWTGQINQKGYPRVGVGSRAIGAHRVMYELLVEPIPDGLELDHLCRVRHCVNPDHLEPVTHRENTRRGKPTRTRCKNGHKFTPENTYIGQWATGPVRLCRTCKREQGRNRDKVAVGG
jgi:hypothetical protein